MNCQYCNNPIPNGVAECPCCGAAVANNNVPNQQMPNNNFMGNVPQQYAAAAQPVWMAITSLILGAISFLVALGLDEEDLEDEDTLIGILICCSIPAILSLIFGIISLAKKYPQKTLAIIGIVLAALALLI